MSFEKEYSEATEVSTLSLSLFAPAIVKFIYILGLHLSQFRHEICHKFTQPWVATFATNL